ncbi:MAG: DNA-directed RNA polymerase subunit beta', partial [Clostridia bacterium]|nr:DNA-directed RNA polymerase subunit beta' [Clostridia bacterium]
EARKGTMNSVTVTDDKDGDVKTYLIPANVHLKVEDGDVIAKGTALTEGPFSPHDVLRTRDIAAVRDYLIQEVQKVYRQQGVDINDRHIEVIVRQMMRKVKVETAGDTELLPGSMIGVFEFEDANEALAKKAQEEGIDFEPATASPVLLGITKASLATDSFLSAASFQETTRVLTDAAIWGKIDPLLGLKENVLIGKLIPAGSGLNMYSQADYEEKIEIID